MRSCSLNKEDEKTKRNSLSHSESFLELNGEVAGQHRSPRAAFRPTKNQDFPGRFFLPLQLEPPGRCADHGIDQRAGFKWSTEQFTSAGAHASDQQFRLPAARVDHHCQCGVAAANVLYQVEGHVYIAVQIDHDDVATGLRQLHQMIEIRIGAEFPAYRNLLLEECLGKGPPSPVVRTN